VNIEITAGIKTGFKKVLGKITTDGGRLELDEDIN
jgi:hypothetical protein